MANNVSNVSGASLGPIYQRLNGAPRYHPLEADTFADWSLEAGDIVTVSRDGKSYQSPVHTSQMTWKRQQQISLSSKGNEKRGAISKMSQQKFNKGSGGVRNSDYIHLYVEDQYKQMRSGLELTASSAKLYSENLYLQMRSGLELTASTAFLYVDDVYNQMKSGLKLTSSYMVLYVDNKYAQMRSGLSLTASSAALYVDNRYAQMRSGLNLTASSAALYVDNRYAQMRSGLNLTASSAALYTQNRTTRAYIVARINANGEGEALIEADKVKISGTTTINDVLTITDNRVRIKTDAQVSGNLLTESVTFRGLSSSGTISGDDIEGFIKSASVDGNTLTLTPVRGDPITFSKATTLSGAWSGGVFTVNASPQGNRFSTTLVQGTASWSGNSATVPVEAYDSDNPQYQYATGRNIFVDATARYNAGDTAGYNRGYTAGGKTASVGGPNSITSNGTYTYKGYYENQDGDDVESGHNLTVRVNVSGGGSISAINMVSTAAGPGAVAGYTWSGSLTKPSGNAWLRITLSGGDKLYYDVT